MIYGNLWQGARLRTGAERTSETWATSGMDDAPLMVADVIPRTLSRINSPTPQHINDYPFTPFNNYIILPITRKIHSIHTHDLTKAYTRRTLIISFTKRTSWHLKTIEDNNMIRGDDPVTLVNEKHETQFPIRYIVAQPHELTRLRALVEPNNTATTGHWSTNRKRDSHTPRRWWQRRVTDDTKSSRAAPCQQQSKVKGVGRRHRLQ